MRECESREALLARLLAQSGRGDGEAFLKIYKLTSAQLVHSATRLVWTREVAEEVVQESFIAIWRDAGKFDHSRSAPLTWMLAIVRNKAVDWLRANHARNFYTVGGIDGADFDQASVTELDPCLSVEREQRRKQVELGLTSLNELHRTAIELCFFKELSHAQVASEMTLPLGTVKTWIRRGCRQIREHMEHQPA